MGPAEGSRSHPEGKEEVMWNQTKRSIGPVFAGVLLGFLLMPMSLVWSLLAGATIVIVALRSAVPATAAVTAKRK